MSDVRFQSNTCKAYTIFFSNTGIFNTLTGKKNGTLISQQQIIPIIPILMYFDQEAMTANITLNISVGYFISNFA
jgi:hypothetical protein